MSPFGLQTQGNISPSFVKPIGSSIYSTLPFSNLMRHAPQKPDLQLDVGAGQHYSALKSVIVFHLCHCKLDQKR